MSGETMKSVSGWTVDTLHIYFDRLAELQATALETALQAEHRRQEQLRHAVDLALAAEDKRITERLYNIEREFHEHILSATVENKAALEAAEKAINKAEQATERRFQSVNEFRQTLTDQAASFMPRAESEQRSNATTERLRELELRQQNFPTRDELAVTLTATDAQVANAANAATEKHNALTERIAQLELRLTSRLDITAGVKQDSDVRRGTATQWQLATASAVISILVVVAIIIANILTSKP